MDERKPNIVKVLDFESKLDTDELDIPIQLEEAPFVKHFFVFVHGNHGDVTHMENLLKMYRKLFPSHSIFLNSSCNSKDTHIGVEQGGKNLAKEIVEFFKKYDITTKVNFSIISHSLGGLFSRNCLRWLYEDDSKIWDLLNPVSFLSICSPHLGSRIPSGVLHPTGLIVDFYLTNILNQTGKDLYLESDVLIDMATMKEYMTPLSLFQYRTLISTIHTDIVVPLQSASLRSYDPYPISNFKEFSTNVGGVSGFEDEYNFLFKDVKEAPSQGTESNPWKGIRDPVLNLYMDNTKTVLYDRLMLDNLHKLKWRRIEINYDIPNSGYYIYGHTLALNYAPSKLRVSIQPPDLIYDMKKYTLLLAKIAIIDAKEDQKQFEEYDKELEKENPKLEKETKETNVKYSFELNTTTEEFLKFISNVEEYPLHFSNIESIKKEDGNIYRYNHKGLLKSYVICDHFKTEKSFNWAMKTSDVFRIYEGKWECIEKDTNKIQVNMTGLIKFYIPGSWFIIPLFIKEHFENAIQVIKKRFEKK